MLPTQAGVEPATSWSPVGRRIQLSHRGRQFVFGEIGKLFMNNHMSGFILNLHIVIMVFYHSCTIFTQLFQYYALANSVDTDQTAP